jgi:hypothetical protein
MLIHIRTRHTWPIGRNSFKWQHYVGIFGKYDGLLSGQKWADPALMRIRLNIVGPQNNLGDGR